MRISLLCVTPLAALCFLLGGCTTAPDTDSGRAALTNDSQATLNDFKTQDASLDQVLTDSYGYAVFPSIGKAAAGVEGAYGQGEVVEQGKRVGYADLTQASVGAALGGQTYSELIIFRTHEAMQNFEAGQTTFTADASAVAIKAGAAAGTKWSNNVAVFTSVKGGLMAEATIGGQTFKYEPAQ